MSSDAALPRSPMYTLAHAWPPFAAALATLTLAACGSGVATESFKGESHAVAQRISDFQQNAAAGSQTKLCDDDLAATVKARLRAAGSDCESALKRQLGQIAVVELTISSIAVDGSRATARVKSTWSGKTATSTMALVKEGGVWKVSGLQ